MGHVLDVGEEPGCRIEDGVAWLAERRIVPEVTAVDEDAAVVQRHYPVAEHVPAERPGLERFGRWIPDGGLKVRLGGHIARAGDNEHLAVAHQRGMDRIDRYGPGHRTPGAARPACASTGSVVDVPRLTTTRRPARRESPVNAAFAVRMLNSGQANEDCSWGTANPRTANREPATCVSAWLASPSLHPRRRARASLRMRSDRAAGRSSSPCRSPAA
jgi:hypothetical protein